MIRTIIFQRQTTANKKITWANIHVDRQKDSFYIAGFTIIISDNNSQKSMYWLKCQMKIFEIPHILNLYNFPWLFLNS